MGRAKKSSLKERSTQAARLEKVLKKKAGLQRHLELGALLVNGSGKSSSDSLREVARQSGVCVSVLSRAVRVTSTCQALPFVERSQHLRLGHVEAVLGLPMTNQRTLLRRADTQRWSVTTIRSEATRVRKLLGHQRGRPPLSPITRSARRAWQLSTTLERLSEALQEGDHGESQQDVEALSTALRGALDTLDAALSPRSKIRAKPTRRRVATRGRATAGSRPA